MVKILLLMIILSIFLKKIGYDEKNNEILINLKDKTICYIVNKSDLSLTPKECRKIKIIKRKK